MLKLCCDTLLLLENAGVVFSYVTDLVKLHW